MDKPNTDWILKEIQKISLQNMEKKLQFKAKLEQNSAEKYNLRVNNYNLSRY